MELELRHLRAVCAIADAGSIGRAAAALGLSQPAMSTQLQRIERIVDGKLFVRTSAGTELTPYGLEVVTQARDLLVMADGLVRRPAEHGGPDISATIRLGATNTPILPGLVAALKTAFPSVAVGVSSVYATSALVEQLETGMLDVALVSDYPGRELRHSGEIAFRPIVSEPTFVALPAGHPLAHCLEVPLAGLSGDAWFVMPDDGAGWPQVFYEACVQAGFTPAVTYEFLGREQTNAMIAAGVGISACPATMQSVPGLVVRPLVKAPLWCRQVLVWRRDGRGEQFADAMHHHAVTVYRHLIAKAPHYRSWVARRNAIPHTN